MWSFGITMIEAANGQPPNRQAALKAVWDVALAPSPTLEGSACDGTKWSPEIKVQLLCVCVCVCVFVCVFVCVYVCVHACIVFVKSFLCWFVSSGRLCLIRVAHSAFFRTS